MASFEVKRDNCSRTMDRSAAEPAERNRPAPAARERPKGHRHIRYMMNMDETEIKMYSVICSHDGIKAREIARETGVDKTQLNRLLYSMPFIRELCYVDEDFCWHGMIRQARPHIGLGDFCGYYATVDRFLKQPEEEWLDELKKGCGDIGRNLNDTRGLIHSFLDAREVMTGLFRDLKDLVNTNGPADGMTGPENPACPAGWGRTDFSSWEICFEVRIKRARHVRIYADVLVITENKVFSLEFKMKDVIDPEEELQAVKYAKYLDVIFGPAYEVIPALVLTRATDLYIWQQLPGTTAEIPVCSGDMLFNLFDEYMGFLDDV